MRKFYFLNSSGERWPLQGEKGVYLTDPTGLGVTLAQTYADLQNGFFVGVSSANEPQSAPHATLLFVRPAYATYRQLIDWLAAAENLELVYCPYGTEEFHRRVNVQAITKGELDEHAFLACELSLLARSPWFKAKASRLDLSSQVTDESMRYDITYSDNLIYGDDFTSAIYGILAADGHVPAAISVTFYGSAETPEISLTGQLTGKLYGMCRVYDTIAAGETLLFSSDYLDSYVRKISADGVETDLLAKIDLGDNPFFRLPLTEPCIISIAGQAAISGTADVEVFYYFRSV